MGDAAVDAWKLDGRLLLWHYPQFQRGMEGWHLNADSPACQSLADLVDLMLAAPWKTRRQIPVTTRRVRIGSDSLGESASELLLRYPKDEVAGSHWQLTAKKGVVDLTLGEERMREFKKTLLGLPHWKDDFALGPEGTPENPVSRSRWNRECLWFWTKAE